MKYFLLSIILFSSLVASAQLESLKSESIKFKFTGEDVFYLPDLTPKPIIKKFAITITSNTAIIDVGISASVLHLNENQEVANTSMNPGWRYVYSGEYLSGNGQYVRLLISYKEDNSSYYLLLQNANGKSDEFKTKTNPHFCLNLLAGECDH